MGRRRRPAPREQAKHPLNDTLDDSDNEGLEAGSGSDDEEQRPGLRKRKAEELSDVDSDQDSVDNEGGQNSEGDDDNDVLNEHEEYEDSEEEEEDDEIPVAVTGPTVKDILAMVNAERAKQTPRKPLKESKPTIAVEEESGPEEEEGVEGQDDDGNVSGPPKASSKPAKKGPLNASALAKFHKVHDKTGVVYLSRIPPFMKPQKLRHLLSQYGDIGRLYLQLEPAHVTKRRVQAGGNRKQNFTEGWVEFLDKSKAKEVASMLNNTMIGGKKRNFYHDDIWNIKYLPGFKWSHLAERIAYEKATRDQKVRFETQQARRENRAYLKSVANAKMIEAIEEKKKKKAASGLVSDAASATKAVNEAVAAAASADQGGGPSTLEKLASQFKRRFKQRKVIDEAVGGGIGGVKKGQEMAPAEREKQKRVLGKIFG